VALSQWIIGIRPNFDGLTVEPRLPSHVKNATLRRTYRGADYVITVENRNPAGKVVLTVDGKSVDGTTLPVAAAGSKVNVVAVIG
jgi:cellobiose phosphorylase